MTVKYTPRGYPYPDGQETVKPQSRDFVDLAVAIDADIASLAGKDDPVLLTADDDTDTLTPGTRIVSNIVIARALDLPWEHPSIIAVTPLSTGSGVNYVAVTAEQPHADFSALA